MEIDSKDMTFNIPKDKLEKVVEKLEALKRGTRKGRRVGVTKVAQVVGLLQSVRLTTGSIVAIMTRALYVEVARAATWISFITITGLAKFEVIWWLDNLNSVTKFPIAEGSVSQPYCPATFSLAEPVPFLGGTVKENCT